jgi:hypothetical protein
MMKRAAQETRLPEMMDATEFSSQTRTEETTLKTY